MKVIDIANEIFIENGEPSDTSLPAVAYWVRSNVGKLNSLIYSNFVITNLEIVDEDAVEINLDAAAILKKMWAVDRYNTLIRTQLTAITSGDDVIEITDDGSTYKRSNKSEVVKSLKSLKDTEIAELNKLVDSYRIRGATPSQVAGDDTEEGYFNIGRRSGCRVY